MNIALINNKIIENIIVSNLEFASSLGYEEILDVTNLKTGIGWINIDNVWTSPNPTTEPAVRLKTILTPKQFLSRFTLSEWENIETACTQSSAMRFWMKKYDKSQDIDLEDQETIDGMNAMAAFNLITEERKLEIMKINVITL